MNYAKSVWNRIFEIWEIRFEVWKMKFDLWNIKIYDRNGQFDFWKTEFQIREIELRFGTGNLRIGMEKQDNFISIVCVRDKFQLTNLSDRRDSS